MSIQSQMDRIKRNIAEAYRAMGEQGATMPDEQNSDNMAATARTILTSGGTTVQADWSVNHPNNASYVKERTHWKEVYDGPEGEVIPETSVAFTSNIKTMTGAMSDAIKVGGRYIVTWNGVDYVCIGKHSSDGAYVGNGSFMNISGVLELEDTGEPFCVLLFGGVYYQVLKETVAAETVTMKVVGEKVVIWHPLDEHYLPPIGFNDLTDTPFDARYGVYLEFSDAQADENVVYPDRIPIFLFHRVSDMVPTPEELRGGVIEWSEIQLQTFHKKPIDIGKFTEGSVLDSSYGFSYYDESIYNSRPYPLVIVLTEVSANDAAKGITPGIYFYRMGESVMVSGLAWGAARRINKELLPVGYPHFRPMETVLPETEFDFSVSTEASCDAITLERNEWYLVTCNGVDCIARARTLIADNTAAGVALGDLINEPFSIKVLDSGTTTVHHESGTNYASVNLSVRRITPYRMGEQYLPPKMVVKVTETGAEDSAGLVPAVMDKTLQDIVDAFNEGAEIVCELEVETAPMRFRICLPLADVTTTDGGTWTMHQVSFAGFAIAGMCYQVTTSTTAESVKASILKTSLVDINDAKLNEAIDEVLK